MRQVKDVSKEAVDATRRKLGRNKHDKTCRVHIKVIRLHPHLNGHISW